jgi:predicted GH43/DUF377 family glycosyl hydrolase
MKSKIRFGLIVTVLTALIVISNILTIGCKDASDNSKNSSWIPYDGNPVFTYNTGLLDGLPNDPSVIKDGNTYVMYYGAIKGDFSDTDTVRIFRATSADGIVWNRNSIPVLVPGSAGTWDEVKVEVPDVVKLPDGTYLMYYAGSDTTTETGFQIGLATSTDGINWTKHPANPVLPFGTSGDFDELSAFEPGIVYDESQDKYSLWYCGMSSLLEVKIGLAESSDGITWNKQGVVMELGIERQNSNDAGLTEPDVIWNGGAFEMFYAVLLDEGQVVAPIWHAVSINGTLWQKDTAPILQREPDPNWTANGIHSPSVLIEGNKYRMWYGGTRTDGATYFEANIGLAEKEN